MNQDSLKSVIAELTIAQVWQKLDLPGKIPNGNGVVCSPLRQDRHASFSVFNGGRRFKDHATGESGDVFDFFKAVTGLNGRGAVEAFINLARR